MIAYHTKFGDIDPDFKPFEITLDSLKSCAYTITCPYGMHMPWEPQEQDIHVKCHCTSEYSPHEFIVKTTRSTRLSAIANKAKRAKDR